MKNDLPSLGLTHRADNPLSLCNGCKNGSLNIGITQYIVPQYITILGIKQTFFYYSCFFKKSAFDSVA